MCPYVEGYGSKLSMIIYFAVRRHFQTIFKKLTDAKVREGVRAMMLILA